MLIGSHSNRKSYHAASEVPHWSVSVPMTLGDLERQVARCPVFWQIVVWPTAIKFGIVTQMGEGMLPVQGVGHQRHQILVPTPFEVKKNKFSLVLCMGRGIFLRGRPRLISRGGTAALCGSYTTTAFDIEGLNSTCNRYREGPVF